jgi:hypothetical protein
MSPHEAKWSTDRLSESPAKNAWFILRRMLPLWKPEETIRETIAFCKAVEVDEILWKIDAEEFNHGFTPHTLIQETLPWLEKAKKLQQKEGIAFSVNPWLTLNHIGRQRYPEGAPDDWHWRVLPDGSIAQEMACPLSHGWREWFFEAYRLYATTQPDKLWLEDDFKTFAYQGWTVGCFCDKHIELFSKKIGQKISREEIVKRLLAPGKPDSLRARWLDFQGRIMIDICVEVEGIVHAQSPQTRLGLMCSYSSEGHWWTEAINALAGPLRPLARPGFAPYHESQTIDFLPGRSEILKECACLPNGTEVCPELENSVYTPYSKSTRMTRLQIALSQMLGFRAITMNLFDMVGTPLSVDKRMGSMLSKLKPQLNTIAQLMSSDGMPRGVNIPFDKRYADHVFAGPGQDFDIFRFDGSGWSLPLQASGIPIVLNGNDSVYAVTGQSFRGLSSDLIKKMLSKSLLIDGSAADVLCELGYSNEIGVRTGTVLNREDICLSAERNNWEIENLSQHAEYMSLRRICEPDCGRLYPFELLSGALSFSSFVNPEHIVVMPGMVVYENNLGGRIAVYPFDLSVNPLRGFMNEHRKKQLQHIFRWLSYDRVSCIVNGGYWMVPIRRDFSDYILIGVLNLESDNWKDLTVTLDINKSNLAIDILDETGTLVPEAYTVIKQTQENLTFRLERQTKALDFTLLRIRNN